MQEMSRERERETLDKVQNMFSKCHCPLFILLMRNKQDQSWSSSANLKNSICGICQRETRPTISEIEMLREAERESWAGRNHSGATSSHKSGRWRETNPKPNSHKYTRRTSSLASIVQQVWLKCHFWMLLLEVQDRVRNWQSVDMEQGSWRIL